MTSSFSPCISVNLFSSTYKRLLLNFYARVFVQTKILTHYINWLQGVYSPKPFPTIIPCTQVNRSPAMEFKITVQHPHSDQVDEYVLPLPTEGSRLCENVTIDGANQRPVVVICCQQVVQAIQHTDPTHRSEPPPLVSIEDSDDSGSDTTVELVLNESDEDYNEYTDRRPTPWPLPKIHAQTQRENVTCTVNPTQRTEAQRTTPVFIIERFPLEVSTTPPLIERIRNRGYVTKSDIDERERIVNRAITGSDEPLTPTKRRRIIEENRRLRDRPRTITPRINPLRNQQRHRTAK